jgi:hypothetical protein
MQAWIVYVYVVYCVLLLLGFHYLWRTNERGHWCQISVLARVNERFIENTWRATSLFDVSSLPIDVFSIRIINNWQEPTKKNNLSKRFWIEAYKMECQLHKEIVLFERLEKFNLKICNLRDRTTSLVAYFGMSP